MSNPVRMSREANNARMKNISDQMRAANSANDADYSGYKSNKKPGMIDRALGYLGYHMGKWFYNDVKNEMDKKRSGAGRSRRKRLRMVVGKAHRHKAHRSCRRRCK